MGFLDAGQEARLDRFVGYDEPYATSPGTLDENDAFQEETRNVAGAVAVTVRDIRAGRLGGDAGLKAPRPR